MINARACLMFQLTIKCELLNNTKIIELKWVFLTKSLIFKWHVILNHEAPGRPLGV